MTSQFVATMGACAFSPPTVVGCVIREMASFAREELHGPMHDGYRGKEGERERDRNPGREARTRERERQHLKSVRPWNQRYRAFYILNWIYRYFACALELVPREIV